MTQKIKLILLLGIVSGCKTNQTLIQRSDVAFENIKTNEVFFCQCGTGTLMYNSWVRDGVRNGWCDNTTKVYLVDSVTFKRIPRGLTLDKGGNSITLIK